MCFWKENMNGKCFIIGIILNIAVKTFQDTWTSGEWVNHSVWHSALNWNYTRSLKQPEMVLTSAKYLGLGEAFKYLFKQNSLRNPYNNNTERQVKQASKDFSFLNTSSLGAAPVPRRTLSWSPRQSPASGETSLSLMYLCGTCWSVPPDRAWRNTLQSLAALSSATLSGTTKPCPLKIIPRSYSKFAEFSGGWWRSTKTRRANGDDTADLGITWLCVT